MNYTMPQKEDIFRTYMYDYLKKRGMFYVAEVFRIEALVTRHPPFEFNQHPHGFLHDFWIFIQNDIFSPSLQMPLGSSNQALNVGTMPTQHNGVQNGFVPGNVGAIPTQPNGIQNGVVPINVGTIPMQHNGVQNGFIPVNVGTIPTQQNSFQNGVVPINIGSVPRLNSLPQQYDVVARKLGTVPRLDSLRQQYGVVPKNVGTIPPSNPLPPQYDAVPVNPRTRPRLDSRHQKYGVVTKNVGTIPQSNPLPQQHDVLPANPGTRPRLDPLLQQCGVAPVKDPSPTIRDTNVQRHGEKFSVKFLSGFDTNDSLSSCDFSSDGKIVASGGFGKKAIICYMDTSDCVTTSQSHSAPISDVRFQQKTTIFATCSHDYKVKLWNSNKPGTVLFDLVGHNEWVKSMDFHPLEAILCSSDNFDVLEVWDLIQCVRLKNFLVGGQQVRFEPVFGKTLAVANGNVINILDIQSWRIQNRFQGHNNEVRSICWDAQGQMIASVTEDCARVWSIAVRGKCMFEYQSKGKRFRCIIFHPKYPNVLVIGGAMNMELWVPETGQVYLFPAHSGQITGLAACKQNETIASSSSDSTVKIWK